MPNANYGHFNDFALSRRTPLYGIVTNHRCFGPQANLIGSLFGGTFILNLDNTVN